MAVPGKRSLWSSALHNAGERATNGVFESNPSQSTSSKRNDPPKRSCFGGSGCPGRLRPDLCCLGRGRLGGGRDFSDGLEDLRSNRVGVALRVRTTIFEITLVVALDERVRHADRSAAVGHAIAERVPGSGLVLAGQALVVVRPIDGDVVH